MSLAPYSKILFICFHFFHLETKARLQSLLRRGCWTRGFISCRHVYFCSTRLGAMRTLSVHFEQCSASLGYMEENLHLLLPLLRPPTELCPSLLSLSLSRSRRSIISTSVKFHHINIESKTRLCTPFLLSKRRVLHFAILPFSSSFPYHQRLRASSFCILAVAGVERCRSKAHVQLYARFDGGCLEYIFRGF